MIPLLPEESVLSQPTAEQRVAAFFAARGAGILDMALSEISAACGVSDATVVRHCRHAGYKGLKDFKIAMAHAAEPLPAVLPVTGDEPLPELQAVSSGLPSAVLTADAGKLLRRSLWPWAYACFPAAYCSWSAGRQKENSAAGTRSWSA